MACQIMAKEVVLRDSDISNAIVNYITNNSISNIVVGSSAHKSFFKSLSFFFLSLDSHILQLWFVSILTLVHLCVQEV